ncbi:MAG: type II toxin-antitoxin system VapB family antitoxin [Acidithiobacillales bacterium]
MRTTLALDDDLYREAKKVAVDSGTTVTALIEAALRESLRRRHAAGPRRKKIRLPTFRGRGVMPGVDLDDSASLLDLMEARHPPARR